MAKRTQFALLIVILLLAAVQRLSNVDWDGYNHYHPDERFITWVGTSIEWPADSATAFQPNRSSFNPFYWPPEAESEGVVLEQDEQRRFAYGHLPLYLGVAATRLAEKVGPSLSASLPQGWLLTSDILNGADWIEFRHITAVGRALTALFDLASIVVVFLLGRWLFDPAAGLLAAALLAVNVMHVQLSHFFTVDPFLTFFVVATLAFLVISVSPSSGPRRRTIALLLGGAAVGLAVGSKFSGALLLLPLAASALLQVQWQMNRRIGVLFAAMLLGLLVFAVTNPFAILDTSCTNGQSATIGPLRLPESVENSCYLQNVVSQGTMVRGLRDVPYVRQYDGTTPFLYFIEMQLRWGMGPVLGLIAFAGFFWAAWRFFRALRSWWRDGRPASAFQNPVAPGDERFPFTVGEMIVLAWTIPFFVTTGALFVKFMRYMQPLTPFLMIYAAGLVLSIRAKMARRVAVGVLLFFTGLYALAFMNMYRQPHPWIVASQWLYENAEPGSLIVSEMWDDRLPDNVDVDGQRKQRDIFRLDDVNWLSGTEDADSLEKLIANLTLVAESDYLALSSNRNYGVIPRLEERYPLSSQYYDLLFDGELGFEVAYAVSRHPNIFGLALISDPFGWPGLETPPAVQAYLSEGATIPMGRFDESFTVYDQPLAIIFKNVDKLSAEQLLERFQLSRTEDNGRPE